MNRLNYIIKRILQIIPVLFIVSILIFSMLHFIGGDPARLILGDKATNEAILALQEKLGLNKPLIVQYGIFIKGIFHLDLGKSLSLQRPVITILVERFPLTLKLTLFSTVLAILFSMPLGYIAGKHKDRLIDQTIRTLSLALISMPSFWVGLLLMILFGVVLQVLPAGGYDSSSVLSQFKSLILPAFTQSMMTMALLMRDMRNSVVDIVSMDYVDFARSKGLTERKIRNAHIFRNALISYVTVLSMRMAYMLGGSVIIETVFALPGIGKLMVDSIFERDYAVVQSLVLLFAALVMIINLLTDIIYSLLDPRVSY
ncbi:MAG: ABC transporter permease [Sphaerochaeta sp.]